MAKRPYGKVNPIGLALVAGIVGVIYWAFIYGPIYLDHMDVKTEVRGAYHAAGKERLDKVKQRLASNLSQVGEHEYTDPDTGEVSMKKGLGITPADVEVVVNEAADEISVSVTYERVVKLFPSNKVSRKTFTVTESGPILTH